MVKGSGLEFNIAKTKLCHFYRKDIPVVVSVNTTSIVSKDRINVLRIIYDSNLTWAKHTSKPNNQILLSAPRNQNDTKNFDQDEILSLLTSNFFSFLYYNSVVCHIPKLKPGLNQLILSASANALKVSQSNPDLFGLFINTYKSCKRATSNQMITNRYSFLAYKLYNQALPRSDWIYFNFNQILTSRQTTFQTIKSNNYKVGNSFLWLRLTVLNNNIILIVSISRLTVLK